MWVSYNSAEYLARRHGVPEKLLKNIAGPSVLLGEAAEWAESMFHLVLPPPPPPPLVRRRRRDYWLNHLVEIFLSPRAIWQSLT